MAPDTEGFINVLGMSDDSAARRHVAMSLVNHNPPSTMLLFSVILHTKLSTTNSINHNTMATTWRLTEQSTNRRTDRFDSAITNTVLEFSGRAALTSLSKFDFGPLYRTKELKPCQNQSQYQTFGHGISRYTLGPSENLVFVSIELLSMKKPGVIYKAHNNTLRSILNYTTEHIISCLIKRTQPPSPIVFVSEKLLVAATIVVHVKYLVILLHRQATTLLWPPARPQPISLPYFLSVSLRGDLFLYPLHYVISYVYATLAGSTSSSLHRFGMTPLNCLDIDSGSQTIVSIGGSFEMGFFRPGNSQNQYLGIWYKKISSRTVVWVANREIPLIDSSGVLKVIDPRILALLNGTGSIIWSANVTRSTVQDPIGQLLESGNLVVRDANDDNPEHFLWQSFDHPCDTLLPGMKLGKNFVSGLERHLSSWKSSDDPGQGDFAFWCDPQGYQQLILSNGSIELYRTGPWNGLGFSGRPNLKPNSIYTYGLVFTKEEVFYGYELINNSVVSRFSLCHNGIMQRLTWIDRTQEWVLYLTTPTDNCDYYKRCGPYGSCNIENIPVCGCLSNFVPQISEGLRKWRLV
ncbi:hypothetical protein ACSBR1_043814 [Camellia fascicularis]